VAVERIGSEATMFGVPEWDSFGQLSVVLTIEEDLGARIEDEATFNRLTSVLDIAAYLAESAAWIFPSTPIP
jgi:acyl carrier protein